MNEQLKEPEDYVSAIKYLAELIQMDLNFGRKETILPRANAILENALDLQKLYSAKEQDITQKAAKEYYGSKGYSLNEPQKVGLYSIVCGESDWTPTKVAITKNDYQMLIVHCPDVGERPLEQYHANLDEPMWLKIA